MPKSNFAIGLQETLVSYALPVCIFISLIIGADKCLINCIKERGFLSFFLSFLPTWSPILAYKVGLCNQKHICEMQPRAVEKSQI